MMRMMFSPPILGAAGIFHHNRLVSAITDAIVMQCENHSQIVGAKRVPASIGGQTLPNSPFKICAGNKRSLTFSIPRAGLDKLIVTKRGKNNRKQIENQ
jgi:hypothetical protein